MDAAEGVGEGAELFDKLGINVEKSRGVLKSQSELFTEVINKLSKMTDETERNAIASALLNTTGERLVPILNKSAEELDNMRERAHELGVVLSEEDVKSLSDLNQSFNDLSAAGDGFEKMIAAKMSPAVERLLDAGTNAIESIGRGLSESGIFDILSGILDVVSALAPMIDVIGTLFGALSPILEPLALVLAIVADALTIIVNVIALLIEGIKQLINLLSGNASTSKLKEYANNIGNVFSAQGATASYIANNIGNNANGTSFWRGGLTWVGEYGPELVNLPRGSQVYSHEQSIAMAGGDTFNVTISARDIREFSDIVRIAQNERVNRRAGYAGR